MIHLEVAPFLGLQTVLMEEGQLRVSCVRPDWLVESLTEDLARSAGLDAPWLPRLVSSPAAVTFGLPRGHGVTLSALWPTLGVEERGFVTVSLLNTMMRAWPVSLFPRSGVLCDAEGALWLVPPFSRCVDGASKTWDEWQFDEYAIGGMSGELTQTLALTLTRLLLEAPLHAVFSLRANRTPVPSSRVASLGALDQLVAQAMDELAHQRAPAEGSREAWASVLAVLEDQFQQGSGGLGALVARAWPDAAVGSRW